jgi:hypothetical protein
MSFIVEMGVVCFVKEELSPIVELFFISLNMINIYE